MSISNSESGLSVRTKLNTALSDLATAQTDIAAIDAALVPIQATQATHTADIADNASAILTNQSDIAANASAIATNAADIATNAAGVATNAAAIAALPQTAIPSQTEPQSPTVGQRWIEIDGQGLILGEWQWSGSAWVSLQKIVLTANLSPSGIYFSFRYPGRPVLIESLNFQFFVPGPTNDANNYFLAKIRNNTSNGGATLLGTYPVTNDIAVNALCKKTIPINTIVTFAGSDGSAVSGLDVSWEKFGTPSNHSTGTAISMILREVRG